MAHTRRRIFLINKPFQFRFSFYVLTWLFALSFVYPLIVENVFDYFIRYAAMDPHGPEITGLMKTRTEVLTLLIITQVLFLAMSFLISLFMSHRIAGPLYKLKQFLGKAQEGDFSTPLTFRKKDYFQELPEEYNKMLESVRTRMAASSDGISAAIAHLEKGETDAAIQTLKAIPK